MEAFLIFIGIFITLLIGIGVLLGLALWVYNVSDPCRHSYERVDTCNDKQMILVCRKCGKIKKLRK
jgi:hypothetical protein